MLKVHFSATMLSSFGGMIKLILALGFCTHVLLYFIYSQLAVNVERYPIMNGVYRNKMQLQTLNKIKAVKTYFVPNSIRCKEFIRSIKRRT